MADYVFVGTHDYATGLKDSRSLSIDAGGANSMDVSSTYAALAGATFTGSVGMISTTSISFFMESDQNAVQQIYGHSNQVGGIGLSWFRSRGSMASLDVNILNDRAAAINGSFYDGVNSYHTAGNIFLTLQVATAGINSLSSRWEFWTNSGGTCFNRPRFAVDQSGLWVGSTFATNTQSFFNFMSVRGFAHLLPCIVASLPFTEPQGSMAFATDTSVTTPGEVVVCGCSSKKPV